MRRFRRIVLGFIALYVGLVMGLLAVMHRPTLFGKVMSKVPEPMMFIVPFKQLWFIARAGHLKVGDVAPNFNLLSSDKKLRVQLSSFRRQKPVVLVFGSYT